MVVCVGADASSAQPRTGASGATQLAILNGAKHRRTRGRSGWPAHGKISDVSPGEKEYKRRIDQYSRGSFPFSVIRIKMTQADGKEIATHPRKVEGCGMLARKTKGTLFGVPFFNRLDSALSAFCWSSSRSFS